MGRRLKKPKFWTLNKAIVLALMGGFGLVLVQVRYDHRSVVGDNAIAWIPIVYSILMIVASAVGLLFWTRGGRQTLLVGFLLAILVGLAGYLVSHERAVGAFRSARAFGVGSQNSRR